jgi:membrane-bound lytic murein transglycosylase B
MAQQRAHEQGNRRRKNGRRDGGRQGASLGLGPRRAVIIVAVPLAVSAGVASAYAVIPRLTTAPASDTPVARVEPQALTADQAVGPEEQPQPLAAPVPAVATPAANLPEHGRIGRAADYNGSIDRIPSASLAAYQRAELIMGVAVSRCRLDWTVLAGVGEVESDHGRAGGNRVTDEGVSRPGVFGKPLNGRGGRARKRDTDAGSLDDNSRWDAPAGPMGLLPSTWSAVAVDSDGDGKRNLQDVDDAALGVAVFVCNGGRDLSVRAELRAALRSLNPTPGYARLVMSLARSYRDGDAATPTLPPTFFTLPDIPDGPFPSDTGTSGTSPTGNQNGNAAQGPSEPAQHSQSPTPSPSGNPEPAPGPSESEPPAPENPAPPADPAQTEPPAPENPAPPADPAQTEPPAPENPAPPADPAETEEPAPENPAPPADPAESEEPSQESCDAAADPDGAESPASCDPAARRPEGE